MVRTGADFYDVDWMPGIRFFDSWEQLLQMMNEVCRMVLIAVRANISMLCPHIQYVEIAH